MGQRIVASFVLALAVGLFGVRTVAPAAQQVTYGYLAYYADSRLWWQGAWGARVYDDTWFEAQTLALSDGVIRERVSSNPPTLVLMLLPLGWLDAASARVLWTLANALLLGASLWMLARLAFGERTSLAVYCCAVALLAAPVAENFRLGQAYVLLLFLFVLAWWSLARTEARGSGLSLAALLLTKLSGIPLWLMLAARREWRALAWATALAATGVGVSLIWLGWPAWQAFFETLPRKIAETPELSVTAYQNNGGFWQHLLHYDAQWNPGPLVDAPLLAWLLAAVVGLGALTVTWLLARSTTLALAFAASATLSVLLFPSAEDYHYVLMLIPLFVLCSRWSRAQPLLSGLGLLAAALIVLPLPYKQPALSEGWLSLLAYPRLYGGWLVWALLVVLMRETRAP